MLELTQPAGVPGTAQPGGEVSPVRGKQGRGSPTAPPGFLTEFPHRKLGAWRREASGHFVIECRGVLKPSQAKPSQAKASQVVVVVVVVAVVVIVVVAVAVVVVVAVVAVVAVVIVVVASTRQKREATKPNKKHKNVLV